MMFEYHLYSLEMFEKCEVKAIFNHVRDRIISDLRAEEDKQEYSIPSGKKSAYDLRKYLDLTIDAYIKRDIDKISERIGQKFSQA